MKAYINRIAVAAPPNDIHAAFTDYAEGLLPDPRQRRLFRRMADRSQIEQRWSCLRPAAAGANEAIDDRRFYRPGDFPSTAERMRLFEAMAPDLALEAIGRLELGGQIAA